MKIQTKVGAQKNANGGEPDLRSSKNGSLVVAQGQSKYYESVLNGSVWIGANLGGTAVSTQAGLSAATPVLVLYNPVGSGVNLSLLTVTVDINGAPAAASSLMLAYNAQNAGAPSSTTLATTTNAILGIAGTPNAGCYRVSTLPAAPIAFRYIGFVSAASLVGVARIVDHIDGEVIIPPGVSISIQASAVISILASFTWEEMPIN